MCFSATASFVAGTALSAVGVVTLKKANTNRQLPFASIPLLFGVQQFIEGFVWLSFQYGTTFINQFSTYAYLGFAYVLWPSFVPFAVCLLESDPTRKRILYAFQALGIGISLYLLYFTIRYPMISRVANESIAYTMPPNAGMLVVGLYTLAVGASCLFSSSKIINFFGILTILFLGTTYYFYTASYVSVWCFSAAILSVAVYLYFRKRGDTTIS